MEKLVVKKCSKCGALVKVFRDCTCENCGIKCCGEEMKALIPNSVDASIEKHVPTYEIKDEKIFITVNHVMEEEHYIEWICMCVENKEFITHLQPGESPVVEYKYIPGSVIYAYCNKHGLWKQEVK